MLFQHTLDLVLSGAKTQTRRVVAREDTAEHGDDGAITAVKTSGRDKYRIGKTYAVQPARGKPAVARIRLLRIERKRASEMSASEARAEGVASRAAFLDMWSSIHGADKLDADVWVLTFELVKTDG
ncbi:MAG: ASCH domain-containing protein [Anaerolineae bacterium]